MDKDNSLSSLGSQGKNVQASNRAIIVLAVTLFLVVVVLIGLIACCIGFSVEISNLKSAQSSRPADPQQQFTSISDTLVGLQENIALLNRSLGQRKPAQNDGLASLLEEFSELFFNDSSLLNSTDLLNGDLSSILEVFTDLLQLFQGFNSSQLLNSELGSLLDGFSQQLFNSSLLELQGFDTSQLLGIVLDAFGQNNSSDQQLREAIDTLNQQVLQVNSSLVLTDQRVESVVEMIQLITDALRGQFASLPASSCAALPSSTPSGYYWLQTYNGSVVRFFCDMEFTCKGVVGGWRKVAELDMTNSSQECPDPLTEISDANIRHCVMQPGMKDCTSLLYPTQDIPYSSVCGRVIGYQFGTPEAFLRLILISSLTVDSQYLDGISLTHGSEPRQHIWSFAAGAGQEFTNRFGCPCNAGSTVSVSSTFVGDDYFCDSGFLTLTQNVFAGDDPLWDGAGCEIMTTCCAFNSPPWFLKQLPASTADSLEIRICRDETTGEYVGIETIEIYVR